MHKKSKRLFLIFVFGFFAINPVMAEMSEAEKLKWLNSDEPVKPKQRPINLGPLKLLSTKKFADVMHSQNKITISQQSLTDGWVQLHQCYYHLNAFPKVEVVYKYRKMRHLKIERVTKIQSAKVVGQAVELSKVSEGASLCVSAQVLSLEKTASGYRLKNGPFRRKFLDGYFPMRVSVTVHYPKSLMRVNQVSPNKLSIRRINHHKGLVILDATFEGILNTQINFRKI